MSRGTTGVFFPFPQVATNRNGGVGRTAMNNPYAAQQRAQLQNANPQSAEGWALVETARRLEAAKRAPQDTEGVLTAVRLNWRIWTIIQASLVDPECPLPLEIRENLLNLSRFIDRRSAELIATPSDIHKIDVLINIDRQIGAGLLGSPSEGEADQQAAAPVPANSGPAPVPPPAEGEDTQPAGAPQDDPQAQPGLGRSRSTTSTEA